MKKFVKYFVTVIITCFLFTNTGMSQTSREWWNSLSPAWKKVIQKQQFKGKDINPSDEQLEEIVKMTFLELSKNKEIKSLKPAESLGLLEVIRCNGSNVQSLEGIEALTNLREIDCSDNDNINSILPLNGLYNLEKLNCGNTMVKSLRPLRNLKKLRVLDVHFATVVDLRVLKGLDNLGTLDVSENQSLFSLNGVDFLPNLVELNCSKTRIDDLAPVAKLKQLQRLDCSDTPVKTLRPLQLIKTITEIDCSNTLITGKSLDYLYGHINLTMFRCKNIDIDEKEIPGYEKVFQKRNADALIIITSNH